jgi:hypothetical protein
MINIRDVQAVIDAESQVFFAKRAEWSPTAGEREWELVAHALRVLLDHGPTYVESNRHEFMAVADRQYQDGGWGPSGLSRVWVSAFLGLMLIRANAVLNEKQLVSSVQRLIDFFLERQAADGRWQDPPIWTDLDATSHPISFFNAVRATGEPYRAEDVTHSWQKGMRLVLLHMNPDGGWYDPDFRSPSTVVASGSPVEMTAHLLQDAVAGDLLLKNRFQVKGSCLRAIHRLHAWQAPDGSWDGGNVDHTMDATRTLMLSSRAVKDASSTPAIARAMAWILSVKNPVGWGDFPGMESNLERLCDGLDTLFKYQAYQSGTISPLAHLWGFTCQMPSMTA